MDYPAESLRTANEVDRAHTTYEMIATPSCLGVCKDQVLYLVLPPRPSMPPPPTPPPSTVEFNLPPPLPPPLLAPAPELRVSPASRTIASTLFATELSLACAPPVLPVPVLLVGLPGLGLSMSALARSSRNDRNQKAASARRTEKALRWSSAVRSFPVRLLLLAWSFTLTPMLRTGGASERRGGGEDWGSDGLSSGVAKYAPRRRRFKANNQYQGRKLL